MSRRALRTAAVLLTAGVVVEEGTPAQVIDDPQHARTQQFLRQVGDR